MSKSHGFESNLNEAGFQLPKAPSPVAEYVPAKLVGNIVFVSGQIPMEDGKPAYVGRVGDELSLEEGYSAAQICCLNCLACLKGVVSSLDKVEEVIKVRGFVNSAGDFHDQSRVIDGASELLVKVFGDKGKHTRAALGTSNLPGNMPVEIEMSFRVKD